MMRDHQLDEPAAPSPGCGLDDLHRWVQSLPWVEQRPTGLAHGVHLFRVECPPLDRSATWLVTGLGDDVHAPPRSIAVLVPSVVASVIERLGWGRTAMPMPEQRALVKASVALPDADLRALALTAYQYAMR